MKFAVMKFAYRREPPVCLHYVRRWPLIAITLVNPNSDGPDDERQIEEAVRAGTFAQSNWLPKSLTNVTSSYINSAKWVI